jgi:hypothetical protein
VIGRRKGVGGEGGGGLEKRAVFLFMRCDYLSSVMI